MGHHRRVVIAVSPRLLGDALSRVLTRHDRDVTVLSVEPASVPGTPPNEAPRFDVAVVSEQYRHAVRADVVIELPDMPALTVVWVGGRQVSPCGLEELVELVDGGSAVSMARPVS